MKSGELIRAIDRLLQEGKSPGTAYEEELEGKPYLSVLRPILNEPHCRQCHESSRPVLGGLMVRQNAEKVYADLAALRNRNIMIGVAGCLIASVALYFLSLRLIIKPVRRVMEGLSGGAGQVTAASAQVFAASQSLAEGASEQAAGIEETSSSVEEMSSMTRQNAENANQANHLMTETGQVVEEANQAMRELTRSMTEITQASEETAKIIKTIDEIAFQTNLLALNAAVEAARAGEAGAGFAVVADEVRNLALRASDAAKNTSGLIEGSVKKIKSGSGIVSRTNDAFGKVAAGAKKVSDLVGEIAAASNEQAQGIEQINRAVAEMDKVVQRNASSAEESASAAEEMNAQAEEMKGFRGGTTRQERKGETSCCHRSSEGPAREGQGAEGTGSKSRSGKAGPGDPPGRSRIQRVLKKT
jgi:methyl-accepting chemotaxis protein